MTVHDNKKYRVERDGKVMEFIVTSLVREKNEAYIKIVHPVSYHVGIVLADLENHPNISEIVQ